MRSRLLTLRLIPPARQRPHGWEWRFYSSATDLIITDKWSNTSAPTESFRQRVGGSKNENRGILSFRAERGIPIAEIELGSPHPPDDRTRPYRFPLLIV